MLARDYKETLSEKMRIAFMIRILPQALQERIQEHLDRLTTYQEVHDKAVNLVQSSAKYGGSDAMDCSGLDDWYGDLCVSPNHEEEDINAISKSH